MEQEERLISLKAKLAPYGVDVEKGIEYCCNYDTYIYILSLAAKGAGGKVKEITEYKNSGDLNNYIVQVHSLKSSLANIGAFDISAKAKALEFAGKDKDIEFIEANTEVFITEYDSLMKAVLSAIDTGDNDAVGKGTEGKGAGVKPVSSEVWQEGIEKILYYIDELEDEYASEIIEGLLAYDIDEESKAGLLKLKDSLESYDMEQARNQAEKIKNNI